MIFLFGLCFVVLFAVFCFQIHCDLHLIPMKKTEQTKQKT